MSFFDIDRWNEIWQTITRNRKRSIMTALGVFWGIFMLTVMLGAGMGLGRLFRAQLGDMSTNTVLLQPQQTGIPYKGMPKNRWWRMNNGDVDAVKRLPEVLYASAAFWGGDVHCNNGERKGDYTMMGYSPDYQRINPQKLIFGRFINDVDVSHKRKSCVIGTQIYKDLFSGGEDPSGKIIKMNGSYFTVVGVIRKQSTAMSFSDLERTVIIPVSLAQQMYGAGDRIHLLAIAGRDDTPSKQVERACRQAVFARHIISPDDEKALWTMAVAEMFDRVMGLFRGISLLTWIVGLGTLLAGIVGVSNIMLVLVKERTQEIGVRRALGAPPRAIISQILSESFVLTFVAGVLGLAAAVGVLSVADSIYYQMVTVAQEGAEVSWMISFGTGMSALAILVIGSLLAGIIPAFRALKIKAVDAIREE
ncbi:MAG: ABC transporter permease [Rikenellaceae bacterium]|nr:ABC transporter permease [Rikenellaceae bacterium]